MATIKQKKLAKKIMEKKGKSVSAAMKEVGYSDSTASNPQQVTNSKGWKELMDEYIPEAKLAEVHKQQLEATSHDKFGDIYPDNDARLKALDLGYKLRGSYKPTQIDVRTFVGWTESELNEYANHGTIPERFITES